MTGLSGWQPARDAHAIVNSEVKLAFREPLNSLLLQKAVDRARETGKEAGFANEATMGNIDVSMSTEAPQQSSVRVTDNGVAFMRRPTPGAGVEVHVAGDALVHVTPEYGGWETFSADTKSMLGGVYPIYADAVPLREVALQYVDIFVDGTGVWPSAQAPASGVIDRNSEFLVSRSFHETQPWHCNTGWFEAVDGGQDLIQCDVSVSLIDMQSAEGNPERRRIVQLRTRQAFRPGEGDGNPAFEHLIVQLDRIHDALKVRLGTLLAEPARRAIGLESRES